MPSAEGVTNTFFQLLQKVSERPFAARGPFNTLRSIQDHAWSAAAKPLDSNARSPCFVLAPVLDLLAFLHFILKVWKHPHESFILSTHINRLSISSRKLCWALSWGAGWSSRNVSARWPPQEVRGANHKKGCPAVPPQQSRSYSLCGASWTR